LHGYVGDGPTVWRRQLDSLSDEFTVIAWDAPGMGRSSDPPEDLGISGYADCLAGFLDALGLRQAYVAGLSFGGALALEFYRRRPAIPMKLVLVSAYAGWAGSLPPDVATSRLQQALTLSALSPEEFVRALLPTMFGPSTAQADIEAFEASMLRFHPSGFRAMARASAEDLRAVPPTIKIPTLLIYGDKDERAPLYVAEGLERTIPTSRLVLLRGAGHVCNIEASDEFDRAVRDFLLHRN
jgi:pimeloyl-ACP methyl ester carboxylesterase